MRLVSRGDPNRTDQGQCLGGDRLTRRGHDARPPFASSLTGWPDTRQNDVARWFRPDRL